MQIAIIVLAVIGFLAVAGRVLRALLGVVGSGVESFLAGEVTSVSARRGDLTGLQEAEARERQAKRARLRAVGRLTMWSALLAIPPFTPYTAVLYAVYSPLWLLGGLRRA